MMYLIITFYFMKVYLIFSSLVDDQTFSLEYGHSEDFSLADAFWACGIMFSNWLVFFFSFWCYIIASIEL